MYEPNTAVRPESPETFLSQVTYRTTTARVQASRLVDRCAAAGFYGPPESAGKVDSTKDNTPRATLVEEIEQLQHLLDILEHQLERIV